ncbi:sensor histidine kinase [Rhodoferax sp. AJA081-3]|uniref:sensor histidine kinase n=1 Tax=Rhodoferax sp. AJA081-3 TaxID=2752316 RepID=UPI001ADF946A|nr:sensor histidine kinase [Rhodoferax sp. AJA081-3]QTN30303.1 sensor histidine kinase [Rhodoferax sp. AJA081-3]
MTRSAWRRSLRIRLLVGTLLGVVVTIVVAGWGLGTLFRQHVDTQFQAELRTHLDQLTAHIAVNAQGGVSVAMPLSDPRFGRPYSGYYWQVDAAAQGVGAERALLRSRSLWDVVLLAPVDNLQVGDIHVHQVAGPKGKPLGLVERSVQINDRPDGAPRNLRLLVAADADLVAEPVGQFQAALWLALGVLGAVLALAAVVQVSVGLAPLRALRTALTRVRAGDAQRLDGDFPVEVMPLVAEFNTVLAHNAAVVERARTHAGNLAHALKTPLSVLANAAQASASKDPDLARLVLEQTVVARRQVDYHLTRAQAAAATRVPGARTVLLPVVEGLVRAMQRIHAQRDITITVLQPWHPALAFRGEAQDLQEMLGNLLDNACKWAAHRVEVRAHADGDLLTITLDDDGPGLEAEQRDAVLRRGVRADEQVPGSGLGLAIVDDLARLYGGQVALLDSPLGGLRAALTLPAIG